MRAKRRTFSLPRLGRLIGRAAAALALPLAFGVAAGAAHAAAGRDSLTLLIPDNADRASWQVQVWTDTAAEEGVKLRLITDSEFLALGASAAAQIPGLVLPDSAHIATSDAVVAAVKSYVQFGGKLMLVYDAGALTDTGFYAPGKSRFSDLAGVDYVLYESLRERVVGFGPVVGTKGRLDSLALPPGKYLPYAPVVSAADAATARFVPTSRADVGGTQYLRGLMQQRAAKGIDDGSATVRKMRSRSLRELLGLAAEATPQLRYDRRVATASAAIAAHWLDRTARNDDDEDAVPDGESTKSKDAAAASAASAALQVVSGYGYGPTDYFHYVTQGDYAGTVYLSSPEHGLVAGTRGYGSGKVLFVNMPLGYFKAVGTDSAPLHGFLNLFAREQVGLPMMSAQPRGRGGLVYNWHVDDGDDLLDDVRFLLDNTKVLRRGPFSIHFTAGPDVVTPGDGNGMNLDGNPAARDMVRRLGNLGRWNDKLPVDHAIGSHGGWNHDLYGLNVNETNEATYRPWLELNFAAIERITGKPTREYSAPVGANPTWAVRWLEQRGVVGMYTVGDGGNAAVRSWRGGARLTDRLWSFPVTPQGKYATFEEFGEFGIGDAVSAQWLLDLQSFVVNHRTNRMFYNHPPGARGHLKAVLPLLARADWLEDKGRFRWYTMAQLADFGQRRLGTTWASGSYWGWSVFDAANPATLADQTWLLPRARYGEPRVLAGSGQVSADSANWVVTANGGTALRFAAPER